MAVVICTLETLHIFIHRANTLIVKTDTEKSTSKPLFPLIKTLDNECFLPVYRMNDSKLHIVIFTVSNALIFIYLTKTICNNIILYAYICSNLSFTYQY
jgi:hypothetical protein